MPQRFKIVLLVVMVGILGCSEKFLVDSEAYFEQAEPKVEVVEQEVESPVVNVRVGDVYVYRDARLVLDISHGTVIYKQFYYHEPVGWMCTTNFMAVREFTNRWILVR